MSARIDPRVLSGVRAASASEHFAAIVHMKENLDLKSLTGRTEDKVSKLDDFSKQKQKDVVEYLEKERKLRNVSAFERFWTVNAFAVRASKDVIVELSKRSDVESIDYNAPVYLPPEPERQIVPLSVTTLATENNISQIKADQVWARGITGTGIKVGIADTGCLTTHADLAGKVAFTASFNSSGGYISDNVTDYDGHGTHVSGIVAGGAASGTSIGAAPGATLVFAKVFDDGGSSNSTQVIKGVEWLIGKGSRIVNLSLGGDTDSFWKTYVDNWNSLGVLTVSAIGNTGPAVSTTTSPGNVPNAIGVGSVDQTDTISSFSSRGPVSWGGTTYIKPDVCAPGSAIKSSWKDGGYQLESGTSMACPHVTGAAALMLSANSTLEPGTIRSIIKRKTYQRTDTSYPNNDYGNGRVDALAAVIEALTSGGTDETAPTIESVSNTAGTFGSDSTVSATVTEPPGYLPAVTLLYRNLSGTWESKDMIQTSGTSIYTAVIPGSSVTSNIYYYVRAMDIVGNTSMSPATAPVDHYTIAISPTTDLSVSGGITCPNPFSPGPGNTMSLSYTLSKPGNVSVRVISSNGEVVRTFSSAGTTGFNEMTWDGIMANGEELSNGVYIYQIAVTDAGGAMSTAKGKIIVLR